jgi:hypothetical protein
MMVLANVERIIVILAVTLMIANRFHAVQIALLDHICAVIASVFSSESFAEIIRLTWNAVPRFQPR